METRLQKWKQYRDEINNNISLQKAVFQANEKLKILTNRLINVYPSYEKKYKLNLFEFKAIIDEIPSAPKFSKEKIEKLIDLSNIEDSLSFSSLEITKSDFSDNELDYLIKDIKENSKDYDKTLNSDKDNDVLMSKTRYISLSESKSEENDE